MNNTTDRERLINEVEHYFNAHSPRFYTITENNVDHWAGIMNKEIAERLKEYGGNPVVPLAPVGNGRPFPIKMDEVWTTDTENPDIKRIVKKG